MHLLQSIHLWLTSSVACSSQVTVLCRKALLTHVPVEAPEKHAVR